MSICSVGPMPPERMLVQFNFNFEATCPVGEGKYQGRCYIDYLPQDKFVDVAALQTKFTLGYHTIAIAENFVLAVYHEVLQQVGIDIPIKVEVYVDRSEDHGPLRILFNPSSFDWRSFRSKL